MRLKYDYSLHNFRELVRTRLAIFNYFNRAGNDANKYQSKAPLGRPSRWHVRRGTGELNRSYHFSGHQKPNATAALTLSCRLERSVADHFIHCSLSLHLRPLPLLHETSFVMGLVTADQAEGGVVNIRARPIEGSRDTALLTVEGTQDAQKCLTAILSGKDMFFVLGNESRAIVKLPLANDEEFRRLYNAAYERLARAQNASKVPYLKRFLRSIDALLDVAKAKHRSLQTASENRKRLLAKVISDVFLRLKEASSGVKSFPYSEEIKAIANRIKPRIWARAAVPPQATTKDDLKLLLQGIDALNSAATRQRPFRTALKHRIQRMAAVPLEILTRLKATLTASRNKNGPTARQPWAREWVAFGACLLAGIVIVITLISPSGTQSVSDLQRPNRVNPDSPALATADTKQAQTAVFLADLPDAANAEQQIREQTPAPAEFHSAIKTELNAAVEELPKPERTTAPKDVRRATHTVGEVGFLKFGYAGCRNSWDNDGLLERENNVSADDCGIRMPAGTKVIIANIRANNDICVRFPDDVVCYWATGDVLKLSKQPAPLRKESHLAREKPTKVSSATAKSTKVRSAVEQSDDEQLKFLFDR